MLIKILNILVGKYIWWIYIDLFIWIKNINGIKIKRKNLVVNINFVWKLNDLLLKFNVYC